MGHQLFFIATNVEEFQYWRMLFIEQSTEYRSKD